MKLTSNHVRANAFATELELRRAMLRAALQEVPTLVTARGRDSYESKHPEAVIDKAILLLADAKHNFEVALALQHAAESQP